jgi:hypothetical protein
MTLSPGWDETETANAITAIPGYSENSSTGGKAANSAIPTFFDDWFHGDFRRLFPREESSALGTKSLEEYSRMFPNYRVKTAVEIGFDTDGRTISSYEVQMEEPSESAPITLEGGPGEGNPFRNEFDYIDGGDDYLPSNQKGPKTAQTKVTVDGVEGVRGAIIFGGNDSYLVRAKNQGIGLPLLVTGNIPEALATFYTSLPAFYSFVDLVFMADGTKVVRVWDASYYPAHALYVGGTRRDRTPFDEGEQWTRDSANTAFDKFAREAVTPGRTPFDNLFGGGLFGNAVYERLYMDGFGDHPAMGYTKDGSILTTSTVEDQLSVPLFP